MSSDREVSRFEMAGRLSAEIQAQRRNNLKTRILLSGRVEVDGPDTLIDQEDVVKQIQNEVPLSEALPGISIQLSLVGRLLGAEISEVPSVIKTIPRDDTTSPSETTFRDTVSPRVWERGRKKGARRTIVDRK